MIYLNEILENILPMINWVVFILVIAAGYFIRATPILKRLSTTLKVLIFSLAISLSYAIFSEINTGVFIASYFIAFGFHSAVLKLLERFFIRREKDTHIILHEEGNAKRDLIGDRPNDR